MGKRIFDRTKKIMGISMLAFFIASLTAASVSAQPTAEFVSFRESSTDNSVTMQFNDESTGDPTTWQWDFGDGDTSTDNNPVHTYTDSLDTHRVTLQVWDDAGNTDTISHDIST